MPDVAELVVRITGDSSGLTASLAAARGQLGTLAVTAGTAQQALATKLATAGYAANQLGGQMVALGGATVAALGLAVKAGSDYQNKLLDVANNTTMTRREIAEMDASIREIAKKSPASMEELAQGFMRVANFGFQAADSTKILTAAMESAVATGAKTDATANALAGALKNFGFQADAARKVMNELHLASAMGNSTLEQFTAHSGRAHAAAAVLGVSLQDVDSALAALTRHQFNPAVAETQVLGIFAKISNPAKQVKTLLEEISKTTGVDLVNDFTAAGLKAKGLQGIIEDIRRAAKAMGTDPGLLAEKLVPAQRGGLGLAALSQNGGFADKSSIMKAGNQALGGQTDPTGGGFADRMKSLSSQVGVLRNNLVLLGADVQRVLVPVLIPLVQKIRDLIGRFEALPPGVKKAIVEYTAFAGVSLLVIGGALKVAGNVALIASSFLKLGEVLGPLVGEGGALAGLATALTGPVGIAILAAVALIGLLVAAWVNDWGHIREATAQFVTWVTPYLTRAWEAIKSGVLTVWEPIRKFLMEIWPPIRTITVAVWTAISDFLQGTMILLSHVFEGTWTHIAAVLGGAWDVIAGLCKLAFAEIRSIVEVGLKLLSGDWEGAWKSMVDIQRLTNDAMGQLLGGLVKIFGGLIGAIAQVIYNVGRDLVDVGVFIVKGIWQGIESGWAWLIEQVKSLVQRLIAGVKAQLGVASPSKVFAEIGAAIGAGLAQGIAGSRGLVHGAMAALAPGGLSLAVAGGGYAGAASARARGGGGDTHVHMTVVTPDAGSFTQSRGQIYSNLARMAEYARAQRGE